jgi:catechol 2,3-dioxygenase-like lactoylglutathione lyase family enzyme
MHITWGADLFSSRVSQIMHGRHASASRYGGSAELRLPGENQPIFEIHQVGGEENIGVNHIAFKVDNAQAAYDELRAKGVPMPRTPNFVPATGRTTVNFRDPDGWRLQLVDAERKSPQ